LVNRRNVLGGLSALFFAGADEALAQSALIPSFVTRFREDFQFFYIVFDIKTGATIAQGGKDFSVRRPPASLAKALMLYAFFDTMKNNAEKLNMRSNVVIPKDSIDPYYDKRNVARAAGIAPGQAHTAEKLAMACGNISCYASSIALAKHAGQFHLKKDEKDSMVAFIRHMNLCAQKLGMTDSMFYNCTGAPERFRGRPDNYSTSADITKLMRALERDFPAESRISMGQAYFNLGSISKRRSHTSKYLLAHAEQTIINKTGTTNDAGSCESILKKIEGDRYVAATIIGGNVKPNIHRAFDQITEWAKAGKSVYIQGMRTSFPEITSLDI
jgi:D-alanyl-D-alanine carboxypeptidase